jgi:formylglycine-generating enzyme required for sulfatase activity
MADSPTPEPASSPETATRYPAPATDPHADPEGTRYTDPAPDSDGTRYPPSPADPDATGYAPTPTGVQRRGRGPVLPCRFGDYELLERLGHGGMGTVYKARQRVGSGERLVALKVIREGRLASAEGVERFLREARAAGALDHPSIVPIYDIGEVDGRHYFTMQLLPGGSLSERLRDGPLPPREAARLLQRVAEAVQHAHERGVVHRDLKPANILLQKNAATDNTDNTDSKKPSLPSSSVPSVLSEVELLPKITDFGLARTQASELSLTGEALGTPGYMPPEQARGKSKEAGPAADVYGLGAVLYCLLTARPPFQADNAMETMIQVCRDEPVPPRQLNPAVPRDLETICQKCLSKEPSRRYASAVALAEDLGCFLEGKPIVARPAGRLERAVKWARRQPALAALLGVIALALASLVAGGLWVTWYLDVARRDARRDALEEADKAKKARDFLLSTFLISKKDVQSGNITARQILNRAEERIRVEFAQQPELRAELLDAIEDVNRSIRRTIPAAMILEVRGGVRLESFLGENKAVKPQVLLFHEDRLTLAADAQVKIVCLSDLHQERLQPGREATIGRNGCEPADAVSERSQDVLMTFVRLPKGTFYMGWDGDEKKAVKTEIKEDFEIAVHDVTQGQWQAVMGTNPSWFSRHGGGTGMVKDISDEELKLFPVEQVSWDDVQVFLKKLNEKNRGLGYLYCLPTEAEWEYACRGGATSLEECSYHFYFDKPTNDLSSEQANFDGNYPFGNASKGTNLQRTTRVGAYPPNKLGLYDMHGNVWQWCADYVVSSLRVSRGGSWSNNGRNCQAANRDGYARSNRYLFLGCRLARAPVR